MAIFNSKLLVHQRVQEKKVTTNDFGVHVRRLIGPTTRETQIQAP